MGRDASDHIKSHDLAALAGIFLHLLNVGTTGVQSARGHARVRVRTVALHNPNSAPGSSGATEFGASIENFPLTPVWIPGGSAELKFMFVKVTEAKTPGLRDGILLARIPSRVPTLK